MDENALGGFLLSKELTPLLLEKLEEKETLWKAARLSMSAEVGGNMSDEREMTNSEARVWKWMRERFPYLPESMVHQDLETLWLHLAIIVMSMDKDEQSYK